MFKIIFWPYNRLEDEAMPYSPEHKRDTREKFSKARGGCSIARAMPE